MRAGHCADCGTYVYLRPDGFCVNGHDPSRVSAVYEAPDHLAPPAAFAAPAQPAPAYRSQPPAPAYSAPQQVAPPAPRKKHTGLIVALVVGTLLLCCCGGVIGGVMGGIVPNPVDLLASPEHQKVAAAGRLFEAIATADAVKLRAAMPSDAAAAADPVWWIKELSKSGGYGTIVSQKESK